jgi:hypothetical protein
MLPPLVFGICLALTHSGAAAAPAPAAQNVVAEVGRDRVLVRIAGKVFTEYLFTEDEKYPYFYPVNGPRTGRSITERRLNPYPHHSSLFFGCDKVNGGNYWQDGLERGRIVSKNIRLVRGSGPEIEFRQECRWERPGAEPPFDDHRTIRISAPSPDLRYIDFEVTLVARIPVRIEKTNHSLFAVRMAPEFAVKAGGVLVNAQGERGEAGTFGRPSAWADFRGTREGETEGVAILCHPDSRWYPSPWFTRDYGFMSPTPMYWPEKGAVELKAGESVQLRYRVLVHAGNPGSDSLEREFRRWSGR